MSTAMEIALWFCVGFIIGMLLMAYASMKDRKEQDRRHNEAMKLAKRELDEAVERAQWAETELEIYKRIN